MDTTVLAKAQKNHGVRLNLDRPPCPIDVVARPRLLDLLDQMAMLTMIVAPAGYGKTTLMCNWLETRARRATWLALDAEDSDVCQFLTHLLSAVRKDFPAFGSALDGHIESNMPPPTPVGAEMLYAAITEIQEEFILILDDFHLLEGSAVPALVAELIRLKPAPLHMIVAARHDTPLPLASLRMHARIVEIRSRDLRFNAAETCHLFGDTLQESLDQGEVAELVRGTEGWVMSLRLAKLYLRQEQGFASLRGALDVGARHAMDFLAEEVFANLAPGIQTFLMQTAILERVAAPLCAALFGGEITEADARAALRWLEDNGVFVTAIDEDRTWFRYHALFQQFIVRQMHLNYTDQAVMMLHRCASKWYGDNGFARDAIRHALAADDEAEALRLFVGVRRTIFNGTDWSYLAQLVRTFPRTMSERQPVLTLSLAWLARQRNDNSLVRAHLAQSIHLLKAQGDRPSGSADLWSMSPAELECEVEALYTYLDLWGADMAGAIRHGTRCLQLAPEAATFVLGLTSLFLVNAYQANGQMAAAYALLDTMSGKSARLSTHLLTCRGTVEYAEGNLPAVAACVKTLLAIDSADTAPEDRAMALFLQAAVNYYHNDLADIELPLQNLLERRYQDTTRLRTQAICLLALTYQAQQRSDDANKLALAALVEVEAQGITEFIYLIRSLQAELALRQGRADAGLLASEIAALRPAHMLVFYSPQMTLVRLYLQQNTSESLIAAAALLDESRRILEAAHNVRFQIEVLALEARYWQMRGDRDAALSALRRAVELSQPGGIIRIIADNGPEIDGLLLELQQQGTAPLLIAAMRAAIAPHQPERQEDAASASTDLAVLLTFREQEVLRLIGAHLTNREIARILSISPDTVKRHSMNIFRKLDVKNRRSAAKYARDLDWQEVRQTADRAVAP